MKYHYQAGRLGGTDQTYNPKGARMLQDRGLLWALPAAVFGLAALLICPAAARADTFSGASLPLQSNGAAAGVGWTLISDSSPGGGDSVTLTATIANNSVSTTARNEVITFADGGTTIGTATIPSLAPGASDNASVTWAPASGGSHALTATAASLPDETNTANNVAALSLTVYNYYTYTTNAGFSGRGKANGTTEVDNWYKFNIGVPMSMVKQVRVTVPVSTYDPSGSRAVGVPDPCLQSYTGDGTTDLASVGTVTPTGTGNWVMNSQDPAVTATVKPLADNYLDLWIKGLDKTASTRDTVVTQGLTIQIKYLAP